MQAKQPLPLPEQKEIFYVLFSVCFLGPQVSVAETCTTGAVLVTMAMMAPLARVHSLVNRRNSVSDAAVMADKKLAKDSKSDFCPQIYIQFILIKVFIAAFYPLSWNC